MVTISLGNKKKQFRSIREAAEAAGMTYITFYQRLRAGDSVHVAIRKPVRKYVKKAA